MNVLGLERGWPTGTDKPLSFILGGEGNPRKIPWDSILLSPARVPCMPNSTLVMV